VAAPIAAPPLAVGSEHVVHITDLLANGQGVGRIAGLVVFVWGPLPDERARVRVTEVKKTYAVAEAIELLERSPERATPFCPVFGTCGGCQTQHLSYVGQLRWKARLVRDALERIGGLKDVRVEPTIGMREPRAYRNKMALVVKSIEGETDFGFYQMRSHDFVPIAGCPVVLPQLDEHIAALRGAAKDPRTAPAFADVRHAIARAGSATGESVLSLTTDALSQQIEDAVPALAATLPGVVGISNSFAPPSTNAVMGRKHAVVWGRAEMEERIPVPGGDVHARYRVSAASFFQINTEMVGRVFEALAAQAPRPQRVVDLYCGAGTFSMLFALLGADVIGIEENPNAVREAHANAKLNGVRERTRFLSGRVEALLARPEGRAALRGADVAFLDPPRKGSDPHTLDALVAAKVPRIWYLSCNPATLARDLAQLCSHGYALGLVQPLDFFPQTGHVETLTMLTREGA
jgi:23S rRNA (uracil1939-C5)-methyltransferase